MCFIYFLFYILDMDHTVDGNGVTPGKALGWIKNGLETDKVEQVLYSHRC